MTKAQRIKAERLLLEGYIKTNPQVKTFLDTLINKETVEQGDIIEPVIRERLKEARATGIDIGWQAAFLRCEEAVNDFQTIEEIRDYVIGEANKIRERLKIKTTGQN